MKITNSAALALNVLQRKSKWLDPEVSLDYCRTFVLSNFQYCNLIWYFCSQADMMAVERIQKCMLKMVYENYDSAY